MISTYFCKNFKSGHKLLIIVLFFIIFVSHDNFKFQNGTFLSKDITPVYSNYVLTKTDCGGLGNQLFRFAIIYGIGRNLSRTPVFDKNEKCEIEWLEEVKKTFPNLYKFIKVKNPSKKDTVFAEPFWECCNYSRVENITQKYLIFEAYTPFPIGFFKNYESEIKYLLKFDEKLVSEIKEEGKIMFGNDTSPKLCIHFRRGDFLKTRFVESRENFIVPAALFIKSHLFPKTNISLILIGKDDTFTESLKTKFNNTILNSIFVPNLKSRTHDLAFSSAFCDSLLISSSGSTFAWWMGYLMRPNAPIFYNNHVLRWGQYSKNDFQDLYPQEWIRLNVINDKTIKIVYN